MTPPLRSETIHASSVAIGGRAVLIEGVSGAGKSDLALRLIDRGAALVCDDYSLVRRDGDRLSVSPPDTIAGKIEVRGLGIVDMDHLDDVPVALMVQLTRETERLPAAIATRRILDVEVPLIPIAGFEASAPIKVELALRQFGIAG